MAEAFFRLAVENKIDPSVGFILQIPERMQRGNDTFHQVKAFCVKNDIEITPSFYQRLAKLIADNDINRITPLDFIATKKKAPALKKYFETKKEAWGVHSPFFFQTSPDNAFYIYRTSSDAFHAMIEMLTAGQVIFTKEEDGNRIPLRVNYILEHVVTNNLCYALFDLDDYTTLYNGIDINEQEIKALISGFPSRFTTHLIESGCIDDGEETLVEVKLKNRSRFDEEKKCMKLSYHYIFSVIGPKTAHSVSFSACTQKPFNDKMSIATWLSAVKDCKSKQGNYSIVPAEILKAKNTNASFISVDLTALPGGPNGFTTLFSVKKSDDPPPVYGPTTTYCLGCPVDVKACPYPTPHGVKSPLPLQVKLHMLYDMSYTVIKEFITVYTDELLKAAQVIIDNKAAEVMSFDFILFHSCDFCNTGESNPIPLHGSQP